MRLNLARMLFSFPTRSWPRGLFALLLALVFPCAALMAQGDTPEEPPPEAADAAETPWLRTFKGPLSIFHEDGFRHLVHPELPGSAFGERPLWSSVRNTLVDPTKYDRITSLDVDDPNSFFYTQRCNILGVEVEDEWDWFNLINTDRSDFTDTPFSVGKGISYLESGFTYNKLTTPATRTNTRGLPEALLRYGLTDEIELRLKYSGYAMMDQLDVASGQRFQNFGTTDTDLAFKYEMFQQRNWLPLTTVVAGALLPTGTRNLSGNTVQPHFNLVAGWALRRWCYLKTQTGWDYFTTPLTSFDNTLPVPGFVTTRPPVDSWHTSVSTLYQLNKRIGGFVEWFSLYGRNQPTTHFLDTGIFYYITPSIQLDAVIGKNITIVDGHQIFTKAGFSTRW